MNYKWMTKEGVNDQRSDPASIVLEVTCIFQLIVETSVNSKAPTFAAMYCFNTTEEKMKSFFRFKVGVLTCRCICVEVVTYLKKFPLTGISSHNKTLYPTVQEFIRR